MERYGGNSRPMQKADCVCLPRRVCPSPRHIFGRVRPIVVIALVIVIFVLLCVFGYRAIGMSQSGILAEIGTSGLAWKTNRLGYITELHFDNAKRINIETLQLIAKLGHLRTLEMPNVMFSSLDEVREITRLRRLQKLFLPGSNLTDEGLFILISMPSIRFLDVDETNVSRAAFAECISRKPDIEFSGVPNDF